MMLLPVPQYLLATFSCPCQAVSIDDRPAHRLTSRI